MALGGKEKEKGEKRKMEGRNTFYLYSCKKGSQAFFFSFSFLLDLRDMRLETCQKRECLYQK